MQVPERLALIGGSILLASTLVFTLKSQASSIIPQVSHSISGVYDHIGDAQKSSDFDSNYQQAQKNGWTTGQWGTSNYYIDKDNNLHVGSGNLQGAIFATLGQDRATSLHSVNFDQSVKAPEESNGLIAQIQNVTDINGLSNLDTSQVVHAGGLFANDNNLQRADFNALDTSSFQDMSYMFNSDWSLKNIDLSNFNTKNVNTMAFMFEEKGFYIDDLNLSSFDTSNVNDMNQIFGDDGWNGAAKSNGHDVINKVTLGDKTNLKQDTGLSVVNYQNGNQTLNSIDLTNGTHPGTWVKQ